MWQRISSDGMYSLARSGLDCPGTIILVRAGKAGKDQTTLFPPEMSEYRVIS